MKYASRLAHRVIEGQAFVADPKEKVLHSLNATGSRVWELVGRGADETAIVETLLAEFDGDRPGTERDVRAFLARLHDLGLLVKP